MNRQAHPSDDQLYDLAGKVLPEVQGRELRQHLSQCKDCSQRYTLIKRRSGWVGEKMSYLGEGFQAKPIPEARSMLETRLNKRKEKFPMFKKSRTWAGAAIALILVVALFAIPSVRAAAVNFLGLFRVQQIQVVTFNPANLPQDFEGRLMDFEKIVSDNGTFMTDGEPVPDVSQRQAADLAGFDIRLPAGDEAYSLSYQPSGQAEFMIDLALWQALLESLGQPDVELPKAIDGEAITVHIPNSVTYLSAGCDRPLYDPDDRPGAQFEGRDCTMLVQLPGPTIEAPPGLPLDQVGRAFLEILGLSPEEAEQFSRRIDWSTTLVMPVPQDADVREVSVNGYSGTLFANEFRSFNTYQLMWVQDGIVYALSMDGNYDATDVIRTAESLQ